MPHPLVITGHSSTAGQPDEPVAAFILVNTHTDTDKHTDTHRQTHTFVWRREQMEIEAQTLTMAVGVHRLIVPVIIKKVIELILHE